MSVEPSPKRVTAFSSKGDRIIWCDLEMSGLDINKERIIEVALAITDYNMEEIIEGPNLIIHQSNELLNAMDDWNTEHHGNSGLTQLVRESKISETVAEDILLDFVKQHVEPQSSPLGGNSIYMDRMFLLKYMPRFAGYLHHRLIDVSTIKELSKRWYPEMEAKKPEKLSAHRALDDIKDSIKELKFFQQTVFVKQSTKLTS